MNKPSATVHSSRHFTDVVTVYPSPSGPTMSSPIILWWKLKTDQVLLSSMYFYF